MNEELVAAWTQEFARIPEVEVSVGDIFGLTADAIVSPANSFGFMDGGIDLIYSRRFGSGLQQRLRELLAERYSGELPVGCAVVVPTGDPQIPYCISAPTMRVPMNVSGTVNAYLAFRAALLAAERHNRGAERKFESLLCPGLGTAVGRMPCDRAARQMRAAWSAVRSPALAIPHSLGAAMDAHDRLLIGED